MRTGKSAWQLDEKHPKHGSGPVGRLLSPDAAAWTEHPLLPDGCRSRRRNSPPDLWSFQCHNRSSTAVTFCFLPCGEEPLLRLPASLLPIAFTGQCLLDPELLARLQVEGVPFDFPYDVLLNDLPLEPAERVLHCLAVLEPYLGQTAPPSHPDSSGGIMGPLPTVEPLRPAPTSLSVPCRA